MITKSYLSFDIFPKNTYQVHLKRFLDPIKIFILNTLLEKTKNSVISARWNSFIIFISYFPAIFLLTFLFDPITVYKIKIGK